MRARTLAASILMLSIAGLESCLYIPPLTRTAGFTAVESIERGRTTRAEVEKTLPAWPVLRKADTWVYAWEQSHGYIIIAGGYNAYAGELTGPRFSARVRFDGDVVSEVEYRSSRPRKDAPPAEPEPRIEPRAARTEPPQPAKDDSACLATSVGGDECLVAYDADGQFWVPADGPDRGRIDVPWKPKPVKFKNGKPRRAPVELVAVSPTGNAIVVRHRGTHYALDLRTRRAAPFPGQGWWPYRFSPDGHLVAMAGAKGTLVFMATDTWTEVARIRPVEHFTSIVYASGAPVAAVLGRDGDIAVIDVPQGNVRARVSGSGKERGREMALSPEGRRLAVATWADLEVWDLPTVADEAARQGFTFVDDAPTTALVGVRLLPIAPAAFQGSVAFSSDGRFILVHAGDNSLLFRADVSPVGLLNCNFPVVNLAYDAEQHLLVAKGHVERASFDIAP